MSEGHDDGTAFALVPVFLAHDASMMTRGNIQTEGVLVVDLHAVDTDVYPTTFFRLGSDDTVGGPDVTPAVELMPVRCWKNRHVDVSAGFDVFENRSGSNDVGRNRLYVLQEFFPPGNKLDRCRVRGHADRQSGTGRGVDEVRCDAEIRCMVRDLIEQHQR